MKYKKFKRIFVIVCDSMGAGSEPDAADWGDEGSNTLVHTAAGCGGLNIPVMNAMGIHDLDEIMGTNKVKHPQSYVGKAREMSNGKDTMTGHWEMMGIYTTKPFQTFTETGFPKELMDLLAERTGHKLIGNYAASGTEIIKVLGEEQMRDNSLIIYTSGDSVLQIAAHEDYTYGPELKGVPELYRCCDIAREICMKPEWKVGRIIARPFIGPDKDHFVRTPNRHDLTVEPPVPTAMNLLKDHGYTVSAVGKINDIFAGCGVTQTVKTVSNEDGMNKTIAQAKDDQYTGLCFVNLVEFDSEYGHRRNVRGYGNCIEAFDKQLGELVKVMNDDDLVIVTADHGNDPTWHGTDHTREKIPLIMYSKCLKNGRAIEERPTFGDIGATVLKNFGIEKPDNLLGTPIEELFED